MASRRGVLLVADMTDAAREFDTSHLHDQLHRLGRSAAVAIALLPGDVAVSESIHKQIPNLLFAQHVPASEPLELESSAQLAMVEVSTPTEFARKVANCELPVIAVRKSADAKTIELARADCDQLQNDLATFGGFAGYVV